DKPLEELATALVQELRIGGKTREERGVLLLYDVSGSRLKIEVGYGLEGIFPDAFVNYLVRDHARLFFASGDLSVGLRLMLRLLQHRVREAVLGDAFDPTVLKGLPSATYLSGGAGVTSAVPRVDGAPAVPAGRLDPALRERLVAQDSPHDAFARYLEWLARPVYDPDVDLFTTDTRRYLAQFPLSPAYAEFILMGELGKRFTLVERGDLAILFFTGTPFTSPHFFVRESGKWRMDIAAEVRNTREFAGGRFNWGYVGTNDAYSRAFADLLVNLRGVRRFRDGDNREIPVRGLQGS
ncbi:MAG: TPM domain-containing protein, partial [Betaproteobacteria bacterium]|nr:TPM domain-containing protein [Betaproteobacteria bacterium]